MQRERFIYERFEKNIQGLCHSTISLKGVREKKSMNQDSQYRKQMKYVVSRIKRKKSKRNSLEKVGKSPASSTQDTDSNTGTHLAILTEYSKLPSVPKG